MLRHSLLQIMRTIPALGLSLVLLGVLLLAGQHPTLAFPLTGQGAIAHTIPDSSPDLKAAVDRALTSIPAGYYKIDDVEGLKHLQADSHALLVDVREPSEYQAGHIPTAINLPLRSLAQHLDQIVRDRPVVLYCSTGYRSAMGVVTLHLLGYDNVQGFPPSLSGWKAAGEAIALF